MVNTLTQPILVILQLRRAAHIPLESNACTVAIAFDLVVEALARDLAAVQHNVVVEGRDGVFGDRGIGEVAGLELRGAPVETDVAVAAGEGALEGLAVESDVEGEVEFAVGVVFIVVWRVAVVARGWGGEDQVGGVGKGGGGRG